MGLAVRTGIPMRDWLDDPAAVLTAVRLLGWDREEV